MKIYSQPNVATPQNYGVQNNENTIKKTKTNSETIKSALFEKGTPAEIIGRSQLCSFKGVSSFKNSKFTYENVAKNSFLGGKVTEKMEYDSKTGDFVFLKNINGVLIHEERYNPKEQSSYVMNVDADGYKTETEKNLNGTCTIVKNPDGFEILKEKSDNNGNFEKIKTEYNIGRQIVETLNLGVEGIHVYDLRTGEEVFDGELVEIRTYDEQTDSYLTHNILTKILLKEEFCDSEKNTKTIIDYDKETGNKQKKTVIGRGTTRITKYDETGKMIISDVARRKMQDGSVHTLTYSPTNPNELLRVDVNRPDNTKDVLFYEKNLIKTKEHYNGNKLAYTEERMKDGKSVKSRTYYFENGTKRTDEYSLENPKIRTRSYRTDMNNRLIQMQIYNKTGEFVEKERNYAPDMSYTEILYGVNGEIISVNEYDKNGNPKIDTRERERKFNDYSRINFFDEDDFSDEKTVIPDKEEVLPRLDKQVSTNRGLSSYDYMELATVLDIKDIDLEQADGKEIRKLIIKFHPDRNPDDKYATTITQILNYIYSTVK